MKKYIPGLIFLALLSCAQSTIVFDPVNNKASTASTAATQGTLTVNVNLTTQGANHQQKPFSVLVFQNGVLMAAQYNNGTTDGTDRTSIAGVATLIMKSVDVNGCPTATNATLTNGTYDVYFAIQYAAETVTTVNAGATCGANGFIEYSSGGNLYTTRTTATVNGDSTVSITNSNNMLGRQHTFTLAVGTGAGFFSKNFRCYVVDPNTSAITTATQPIALYAGSDNASGDGCTTGNGVSTTLVSGVCTPTGGAQTYLPPGGSYKYFCYIDSDGNATFGNTGDKVATGSLSVNGANTTYLTSGNFSAVP